MSSTMSKDKEKASAAEDHGADDNLELGEEGKATLFIQRRL